jgi:hypothetical protein
MNPEQYEFELNDKRVDKNKMNIAQWMLAIVKKASPPLTNEEVFLLNKEKIKPEDLLKEKIKEINLRDGTQTNRDWLRELDERQTEEMERLAAEEERIRIENQQTKLNL